MLQYTNGGRGIQRHHGLGSLGADSRQNTLDVGSGLPVDGDILAGLDVEIIQLQVRPSDHQVDIQRDRGHLSHLGAKIRAQGKIRDKLSVHNVDMQVFHAKTLKTLQRLRHLRKLHTHHGGSQGTMFHVVHPFSQVTFILH